MNINLLIILVLGVGAGLVYIYRALKKAEDDPETFDHYKEDRRFRKPEGWKKGEWPEDLKKKTTGLKSKDRFGRVESGSLY
ncbi:hypothetical protein [Negadavirga shengliensis]|uniref:Uncharacterized protein n=1 Tax=Negadavirga shengliensis TaxID=1389218 RepID=A0ABV9SWR5_9BACT